VLDLEDVFVRPEHRRRGIGMALMRMLASAAVDARCERFVWQVLDWNEPAINFYKSIGARALPEWVTMRLEGEALRAFASS
jgi:GNAT superfamily N-acetyltransferase